MVNFVASADPVLDTIVRTITEHVQPELILLFGSRARDDARDDSDYDILIVLRDPGAASSRGTVHDALKEAGVSADVLMRSAADYHWMQHDPGLMDSVIAREARVLYATGTVPPRSAADRVREPRRREGLAMWIRRGEADLREAEMSVAAPEPVWDAIGFHSHACVEKLLKAVIVTGGAFPKKVHELQGLLAMVPPEIRDDTEIQRACEFLQTLYPQTRYPELPEPTPEQAREAVSHARRVRDLLKPRLDRASSS